MLHPAPLANARPTWAEIRLDNLVHNYRVMRAACGDHVAVMPALKADAYGHGAVACARALDEAGAEWFAVALPEEGVELRAAGLRQSILCLAGFWEGQEGLLVRERLTPAMFRLDLLERLDLAAADAGTIIDYHLKVDTGLGRLGVPVADLGAFLDEAKRFTNLRLDGLLTHTAAASEPERADYTYLQIERFEAAAATARARGFAPRWIHAANSAAAHAYPASRGNLIRLGNLTYGMWRDATDLSVPALDWRPVMSLRTRIMFLKTVPAGTPLGYGCTFVAPRESRIATLPIGYEDGLRRVLSNRGRVLVRGASAPIVGRISMDLTLIDVTEIEGVALNDEVAVIGRQGDQEITAEEVAELAGTISYEITCGIGRRVPRIYSYSFPTSHEESATQ